MVPHSQEAIKENARLHCARRAFTLDQSNWYKQSDANHRIPLLAPVAKAIGISMGGSPVASTHQYRATTLPLCRPGSPMRFISAAPDPAGVSTGEVNKGQVLPKGNRA